MHPIEEIQGRAEQAQRLFDAGLHQEALTEAEALRRFIEDHPEDDVLVQSRLPAVERFIARIEATLRAS